MPPTFSRRCRLRTVVTFSCSIAAAYATLASAQTTPEEIETLYISNQYAYDDNLFRLSEAASQTAVQEGQIQSRDDYVNRLTIGLGEDLEFGRQTLYFQARATDVRFAENDHLDHVAGMGRLGLDWELTRAVTGTVSARYNRMLADFASSRDPRKDVLDSFTYDGSINVKVGPRWSIFGGAQHVNTEHGLIDRRADDFEANAGRVGLQYATPTRHVFAIEHRYTEAEFPNRVEPLPDGTSGDYEESATIGRLIYTFSVRTQFSATYGYVERERTDDATARYSGNTWTADLTWRPREKLSTELSGWRELRAYEDQESDYFVSEGFSVTQTWAPLTQLSLSVEAAWEDQEYLGFSVFESGELPQRVDDVFRATASLEYAPRPNLRFELAYRFFDRDSNRTVRQYDAEVASLQAHWRIL
jgi:hypothetical protein